MESRPVQSPAMEPESRRWTLHRPIPRLSRPALAVAAGLLTLVLGLTPGVAPALRAQSPDPVAGVEARELRALEFRMAGPYRGGRVTTVEGVPGKPATFYMGSTGGGVWRTTDAGESWTNLTDGFLAVGSVGAVEVADADPSVIYAGTGSACIRGNVSVGRGLYRSTDGGRTWSLVGLERAGQIGRIVVHPGDPDRVWVAALGNPFGPDPERGVFRSTDGGESWERVLFVSDSTGAVDLAMNPENPREIFAATWRAERKPWTLVDGAREGGLYRSRDGGDSWEKLEGGLPGGLVGRIGVTVSPADPDRVWALVTAKDPEGGLYRSDDGGDTWQRVNREHRLRQRGWYYAHVHADPTDPHTVWVLNTGAYRSVDGGRNFDRVRVPHGDVHDLWISPEDPDRMVVGDDGGAQVTTDGGGEWSTLYNQPTAEFYRVEVDDGFPYRLYGAQQDNSTLSVPAFRATGAVHPKAEWYAVGGGESGHIAVPPGDARIVYAGSYVGRIDRYDRETGYAENVILYPQLGDGTPPKEMKYRFQWNAPIEISPHDSEVLYHASHRVHRSTDGGMTWETISPDLTTDDTTKQRLPGGPLQHDHTGVEVYTTVFALTPSPHAAGTLWAGSDDGLVHLTRDDGGTWEDVTPDAMPTGGTVNVVEVSPHRAGKAYLAVYRYREDDWRPYVFRTEDFGASWTLLTDGENGIPADHPVRVVREDPVREGLLFAGTEFGLFVSLDEGAHWQPLGGPEPGETDGRLPVTPVTDLKIHDGDLAVATQGRGFWVLDDLTPLRHLGPAATDGDAHLYPVADAVRTEGGGGRGDRWPENRRYGVLLSYRLSEAAADALADTAADEAVADSAGAELLLEILDADGDVVRRFTSDSARAEEDGGSGQLLASDVLPAEPGLNRIAWDLTYPGPDLVEGSFMSISYTGGLPAPPGRYRARLLLGNDTAAVEPFRVAADPRLDESTAAGYRDQFELLVRIRDRLNGIHATLRRLRSVRDQVEDVAERAGEAAVEASTAEAIREAADSLSTRLTGVEEELIQTENESSQDPINYPPRIDNQFAYLYSVVSGYEGRPNAGSYERLEDLKAGVAPILERARTLLDEEVAAFNRRLAEEGLGGVIVPRVRER